MYAHKAERGGADTCRFKLWKDYHYKINCEMTWLIQSCQLSKQDLYPDKKSGSIYSAEQLGYMRN